MTPGMDADRPEPIPRKPVPRPQPRSGPQGRDDRLKAALKANLARRKVQTRARATDDGDADG